MQETAMLFKFELLTRVSFMLKLPVEELTITSDAASSSASTGGFAISGLERNHQARNE
jgi:hypothetical protein